MHESFDWLKPYPLRNGDRRNYADPDYFQPQILAFTGDDFMERALALIAVGDAEGLRAALAHPAAGAEAGHLKLFQAAHGRFYLVCASLACRRPGFPDRQPDKAAGEQVYFVLRKFVQGVEYAWVAHDQARGAWVAVDSPQGPAGEQRLPLLNAPIGNGRNLWVGYLPTAASETYRVSPADLGQATADLDLRLEELHGRFIAPLTEPIAANAPDTVLQAAAAEDAAHQTHLALSLSVYLLLDLYEFLERYLKDVAAALVRTTVNGFDGDRAAAKEALLTFLGTQSLGGPLRLDQALKAVAEKRDLLNDLGGGDVTGLGFDADYDLSAATLDTAGLKQRIGEALDPAPPEFELPKLVSPSGNDPSGEQVLYAIRCLYTRPACLPPQTRVSRPSPAFRLAGFYDAEAPARPVRIPLPDINMAALRRFNKGVSFLIPESLQKKIERITGREKGLLEDPPKLNPETGGLAFICSFSIQIIFVVAFFLLLLFTIILNILFWWIAFFRICLPVPKKLFSG